MNAPRGLMRVAGAFGVLLLAAAPAAAQQAGSLRDAAQRGDVQAVETLLRGGANANSAQGDGLTALHAAAEKGHLEVAQVLIRGGAEVNAQTRIGRYTPLHLASAGGHTAVVQALLAAGSDAAAMTSNSGVTALHLAAMAPNGEGAVAALIARGAPVNAVEFSSGQTPLMFAAGYGRAAAVRELLAHGANPSITTRAVDVLRQQVIDREAQAIFRQAAGLGGGGGGGRGGGRGAQDAAAAAPVGPAGGGRAAAAGGRGGNQGDPAPPPADAPALADVQNAVQAQRAYLMSRPTLPDFDPKSLNTQGTDYPGGPRFEHQPLWETYVGKTGGMTALLHAAREGHVEAARALLDGGADIDQVSADNTSPLLMASLNGQFDVALLLIERGADPNIASSTEAATPLFSVLNTHWAPKANYPQPRAQDDQRSEYMAVLKALLAAGANPDVRLNTHLWYWEYGLNKMGMDLTGATPFWRAAFAQDLEAMKLLASYGADPHIGTRMPPVSLRERRQMDGRQQEDSGLPWIPEGTPNAAPIHVAAGGGYTGLGAFEVRNVPDNFLNSVKYLVEEQGADVNLADAWGYTPLHYAATRGDNEMIKYLVSKGADVTKITRLGQSTADLARGGQGGFFVRLAYPATVELLTSLGAPLVCLNTHFLDTGDYCAAAGVNDPFYNAPGRGTPAGFPGNAQPAAGPRPLIP